MVDPAQVFVNLAVQRGHATQQVAQECVQLSKSGGTQTLPRLLMDRARIPEDVARQLYQEASQLANTPASPHAQDLEGFISDTAHGQNPYVNPPSNTPQPGVMASTFGAHPVGNTPPSGGVYVSAPSTAPQPQAASGNWQTPGQGPPSSGGSWPTSAHTTGGPAPSGSVTLTPASLQSGSIFNRYRLDKELGRGGMGVVWKGRQVDLDRDVAIKMLLQGSLATEKLRKRFVAEAKAVARLVHPNVVTVHDVGDEGGILFFTMDFVDGPPLSAMLKTQRITVKRALELSLGIAEGLDHAHKQGIVHRDLKPANILIDPRGTPRITDFGIAKDTTQQSTTQAGEVLGTPAYMSPEQADGGTSGVDGRADLYSLGAIMFRMLTGAPPFTGGSPYDIITKVLNEKPASTRDKNKEVPKPVDDLVQRMLKKKREGRPASAGEVVRELKQLLRTMERKHGTPSQRYRKQQDRKRLVVAGVVGAILLAAGIALGAFALAQQRERQRLEAVRIQQEADAADAAHQQKLKDQREAALRRVSDARRLLKTAPAETLAVVQKEAAQLSDDAPTQVLLGRLLLEHKRDAAAALKPLELALKADPKSLEAHLLRGRVLLTLNRSADLETAASAMAKLGAKGRAGAEELRCDLKHRKGDIAVALVHLEKALREAPSVRLRLKRIKLFLEAKRYASAEEAASVCVRLNSASAEALALRGQARIELGRIEDARKDVRSALRLDPDLRLAKRLEQRLRRIPPKDDPNGGGKLTGKALHDRTHKAIAAAEAALDKRNVKLARRNLQVALREPTMSCPAIWKRIKLCLRLHQPQYALRDLKQARRVAKPEQAAQLLQYQAQALMMLGKFELALGTLTQLEKKLPKSPTVHFLRGSIYRAMKDQTKAADSYGKAVELNPKFSEALHQQVHMLYNVGRFKEAVVAADALVKLVPTRGHFLIMQGDALAKLNKIKEARAAFNKAEQVGSRKDKQDAQQRLRQLKGE